VFFVQSITGSTFANPVTLLGVLCVIDRAVYILTVSRGGMCSIIIDLFIKQLSLNYWRLLPVQVRLAAK
jgi:hypothetical protein